jgi:hypothetical protein
MRDPDGRNHMIDRARLPGVVNPPRHAVGKAGRTEPWRCRPSGATIGATQIPREVNGGVEMKASVGDRVIVASNVLDRPARQGTVVEVRRDDGQPPYVVEWSDTHTTSVFFPGADTHVEQSG